MSGKLCARLICIGCCFGALLGYGRRLSLPSPRLPSFPQRRQPLQPLCYATRRPSSAECGNPRRLRLVRDIGAPYSVAPLRPRRCLAPNCGAYPPKPSPWGARSTTLARTPPRSNPTRRTCDFETVGRRGCPQGCTYTL